MSDELEKRAKKVFDAVADLAAGELVAALDRECGADAALRAEVESLLAHQAAVTAAAWSGPGAGGEAAATGEGAASASRTIGPYRIIREIDRGGMGVVYLARREDDRFRRTVALKVLKRGMDTEDVLRRFELERQVLAAMNHPGIARFHDAGETAEGVPYFVMEHVEGQDVASYCDAHRLHIDERLELFRKVCAAVHYAHQNLVVHRDLKPRNIIVTTEGQPKLLDFGIAKIINPQFRLVTGDPTAPELRVMTPEYASPEQVRGDPITTVSDVYSLGVLLYELVSGHPPYRIRTRVREELIRVICEDEPERPSTAVHRVEQIETAVDGKSGTTTITPKSVGQARDSRPERLRRVLSGDIDNIVMMAMRKEPQRRYTSAEQMAEDIGRHLDGRTVIARRDTPLYRAAKFVRRNRAGVAAAAVIMVLLVGGIVGVSLALASEHEQRIIANEATTAAETARAEAVAAGGREQTQRVRAETEREHARFQRRLAIDMLDSLRAAHHQIARLAGALPARELIARTVFDQITKLSRESRDDPVLARQLAAAHKLLGDLVGGIRNPSFGDMPTALASYREALAIRRTLAEADPGDRDLQRELATDLINVTDMIARSDPEGALASSREALGIAEDLRRTAPDDPTAQRTLAIALLRVGDALRRAGDEAGALDHHTRSLSLRRFLADTEPEDARAQRDLAVACGRMAYGLDRADRPEEARRYFEENVRIREGLAARDATNSRWKRDLITARHLLAQFELGQNRASEAMEQLGPALAAAEERVKENPQSARAKRDLRDGHDLAGRAASAKKQWAAAVEHFEAVLALSGARDPDVLRDLAFAQFSSGMADRAAGTAREAIGLLEGETDEDSTDLREQLEQELRTYEGR